MIERYILALIVVLVCSCEVDDLKRGSINKSEYSILQAYEYEYRGVPNESKYLIFTNALGTNINVLAFPIYEKPRGYVILLANAEGVPKVKTMPDVRFVVSPEDYEEVKSKIELSKEVDQYILEYIKSSN